jgi:hypothetical protein
MYFGKMKRNKIMPFLINRAGNIAKHTAIAASLPLGYVWLPISCCTVMPTVKYGMEEEEPEKGIQKFALNISGMFLGVFSLVTCCCCLGCLGTQSPKEIFNNE